MKIIDEWMGRDLKPELPFHKSSLFAKWPKMMKCTNFSGKFQPKFDLLQITDFIGEVVQLLQRHHHLHHLPYPSYQKCLI